MIKHVNIKHMASLNVEGVFKLLSERPNQIIELVLIDTNLNAEDCMRISN